MVWNKKKLLVNKVVADAMEYLTQRKEAQGRCFSISFQSLRVGDGAVSWVKPQRNTVKVTVDAAIFKDQDAVGIGLIARDYTGMIV